MVCISKEMWWSWQSTILCCLGVILGRNLMASFFVSCGVQCGEELKKFPSPSIASFRCFLCWSLLYSHPFVLVGRLWDHSANLFHHPVDPSQVWCSADELLLLVDIMLSYFHVKLTKIPHSFVHFSASSPKTWWQTLRHRCFSLMQLMMLGR